MNRSQLVTTTCRITSGQAVSSAVAMGGTSLAGVQTPAAWDAANITIQVSADGVTWGDLWSPSAEVVLTMAAARMNAASPYRMPFMRFRSGTSGTPVNQTANRDLLVYLLDAA